MPFRFWKRIKILPGVHINLSKSGASVSMGPRGAKVTVGTSGVRGTVGLPGTGLYYTTKLGKRASRSKQGKQRAQDPGLNIARADRLNMGFFRRLITPKDEEHLVDGCRELLQNKHPQALKHFRKAAEIPDGAFLAGFLSLDANRLEDARGYLTTAHQHASLLGKRLAKWDAAMTVSLPVTPEVTVHLGPGKPGTLLGLIEACQALGRRDEAVLHARALQRALPDDPLAKLSLAELDWDIAQNKPMARQILKLAADIRNESPIHAALMLYRARALRVLEQHETARDTLTALLRRKKDRPVDLLQAARYERGCVYETLGRKSQARKDFAAVYAEDPDFEDVANRIEA